MAQSTHPAATAAPPSSASAGGISSAPPGKARLWGFRFLALFLAVLALVASEGVLRIAGMGWDSRFLVPVEGRPGIWASNPRFAWRYFPPALARTPVPLEIKQPKPADTVRIFVLGGSAAMGTPEPAFGLARLLEHLLRQRYPERHFEVHNAAMAAINSHVVLQIAKDCSRFQPDFFLVYMGNNEVVGPYGAATVFSPFSPSLRAIRASSKVQEFRLGQLTARILGPNHDPAGEWRGMEMFLEQQLAADDDRLQKVYEHLQANLEDLLRLADHSGAEVILSTVASNRLDSPPFASLHRAGLSTGDLKQWQEQVDAATHQLQQGDIHSAIGLFRGARQIDDRHAELHYRLGLAELQAGDPAAASSLDMARDLDALRFRADSRINTILRNFSSENGASENGAGNGIGLVDAAVLFDAADPAAVGIAGSGLFYEHVHLRFAGNLLLAEAFLQRLVERLGPPVADPRQGIPDLADQLPWTLFDRHSLNSEMLELTGRPPFTGQLGFAQRQRRAGRRVAELALQLDANSLAEARRAYHQAFTKHPDDLLLANRYALLLAASQQPTAAADIWRPLIDRLPAMSGWRSSLAYALADAGHPEAALAEFAEVARRGAGKTPLAAVRAELLARQGNRDGALEELQQAANGESASSTVLFNLGTAYLERGDGEAARLALRRLIERDPSHARGQLNLGAALSQLGRQAAAIEAYRRAIELRPDLALAHNSLGFALAEQGHAAAAEQAYGDALEVDPSFRLAWFNLGDLLLSNSRATAAVEPYSRGLELDPANHQGRYNLAAALQLAGEPAASAVELRRLMAADPKHVGALNNLAWLLVSTSAEELADPAEALRLAQQAADLTQHQAPEILETLSAALTANGHHGEARRVAKRAATQARAQGKTALANSLEDRSKNG